jgi:hydrogenase maturation protein HypF
MALAQLWSAGIAWDDDLAPVAACPAAERVVLEHQLASGFGTTPTSSMGRLFDAVASLAGVRHVVDYEAQAAIELEGLARGVGAEGGAYGFGVRDAGASAVATATPVVRAVVDDRRRGVPAEVVAARFHAGVADLVADLAARTRADTGPATVVLTGGVFVNALLLSAARKRLEHRGFTVLSAEQVPANDGGIALGQLLVGAHG